MKARTLKEAELDDFISGKLSIIELHLKHLDKKISIELIPSTQISKLRNEPFDYLLSANGEYKNSLSELKFSTLEMIEESYTNWYFKSNHSIARGFRDRFTKK